MLKSTKIGHVQALGWKIRSNLYTEISKLELKATETRKKTFSSSSQLDWQQRFNIWTLSETLKCYSKGYMKSSSKSLLTHRQSEIKLNNLTK